MAQRDQLAAALQKMVSHADWIKLLHRALTLDELNHLGRTEVEARAALAKLNMEAK